MATLREVGQTLKEAREAQGQSLEDIATKSRISMRHLMAIEEGNEADLPEVFYVRGFLKKYAEAVGLSAQDVANAYRSAPMPTTTAPSARFSIGPIVYYLLIIVLIGGGLALAWHFQPKVSVVSEPSPSPSAPAHKKAAAHPANAASGVATVAANPTASHSPGAKGSASPAASHAPATKTSAKPSPGGSAKPSAKPSTKPAAKPSTSPSPSTKPSSRPSASPSPAAKVSTLDVTVQDKSWVEIKQDGHTVYEGTASAGFHRTYKGKNFQIRAGNAGGVRVKLNGKNLGALGSKGGVATRKLP